MKRKIYVLGNSILKKDSLPVKLITMLRRKFPGFEFVLFDPTEEFPEALNKELIFLDTVVGLKKVEIFSDLKIWRRSPRNSVHDFDLPLSLGILEKLGKVKRVKIIGIPEIGDEKKIANQISNLLKAT